MARLVGKARTSTNLILWGTAMVATAAFGAAAYWAFTQFVRLMT
jgi:hypothetical protein